MAKVFTKCLDCKRKGWIEVSVPSNNRRQIIREAFAKMVEVSPRCQDHRRKAHTVDGTLNLDKTCDGRCMAATGPICSCSCGGQNHGGKFGGF